MALNILFNADDEKQDGYLDSFDSQGRGIDQQFVRGDQSLAVSLRPVVPNTSTNATRFWNDDHQTGDTYQVAIGNPDQAPSSGVFGLSLGGSTTGLTALTMDATVLTTQISAAHSASYGAAVAVLVSLGVFQVTWQTNGAVPQLVVTAGNTLTPDSFVTTVVDKAGDASSKAIQYIVLRQSPVAYCEPSTVFATASVIASVTQAGDGSHNKKVSITLTPGVYAGSFSVTLTKADSSVSHLVASGTISQDAFATLLGVPCNVTREDDVIRVEFIGAQGLSNTPAIAVSNIDLLVPKGVSGLMDLNTVSLYRQFWQSGSSTSSLPFTLSIKRTRASGEIAEIFQHPVTLKRNIIDVTTMVDVTLGSYYTTTASDARFAALNPRVVYTSQMGIALDGSVDEHAAVQAVLNSTTANGGLHLIHDKGTIKHSVSLQIGSNTRFETLPGAQWKLADGSDTTQLRNKNPVGAGGEPVDHDIEIIGGFFDGNGANQGKYDTHTPGDGVGTGEGHDQWNYGIAMFGVRNLLIENTSVYHPRTFAYLVSNFRGNVAINNASAEWATTASFEDTLHIWGPGETIRINAVRCLNGGDDVIAGNIGETDGSTHPWASAGDVEQIIANIVDVAVGRVVVRTLTGPYRLTRLVVSDVVADLSDAGAIHAIGLDGNVDSAEFPNWEIKGAGNTVIGGTTGYTGKKLSFSNWQINDGTFGNNLALGQPNVIIAGPSATNEEVDISITNFEADMATTGGDFFASGPNTSTHGANIGRLSLANINLVGVNRLMVNTSSTYDSIDSVHLSNINSGAIRLLDGKFSNVTGDAIFEKAQRDNESLLRRAAIAGGYNALSDATDENWKRFIAFLYRKFGSQKVENFLDFRLGFGTSLAGLKSDAVISGSAPTFNSSTGFTPADTQTVSYTSTLGTSSQGVPVTVMVVAQRAADESHVRGLFKIGDMSSGNNGVVCYQPNGATTLGLNTLSVTLVSPVSFGSISHGSYFLALARLATTHGISLNGGAFATGTGTYTPTNAIIVIGDPDTGAQWNANIVCAGIIKAALTDADAAAVYAEFKNFLGTGLSLP